MSVIAQVALPTVTWQGRQITRLLIGHNPVKGGSHYSDELSKDMREHHADQENGLALLKRCEELGITAAQFGGDKMHDLISSHRARGGNLQWIATLYCNEKGDLGVGNKVSIEQELQAILNVDPKPIGIQHFGESTDRLYFQGRMEEVRERLKRLRDTGLLVGLCSHLPEVLEEAASQDWDVDFYQGSFYTCYSGLRRQGVDRGEEVFDDGDRARMAETMKRIEKPCLAFKVLGANRKCASDEDIKAALKYAYDAIKPTDVVLVGMWQKYKDQVAQNVGFVQEILGE